MRKGNVRIHHFAHKAGSECTDSWQADYDMSDWHMEWQNYYPKGNQEVSCQLGDICHRADVMVDRTVIEFQHSSLSASNFSKRNHFYHDLGYKVIWVFDLIEAYQNEQISYDENTTGVHVSWIRPRNTFQDSDILSGHIEVFFQINQDGEKSLLRVDSINGLGIESFSSNRWYSKTEFLEYTGLHDGNCASPYRDDEVKNEQYRRFFENYHIKLNPQQERAVQAIDGANLILAVPGSGKTTVLVVRIGYMILCRGIKPESILAITFTNAAAKDMKKRFAKIFGDILANRIQFQTINSLCYGIIQFYVKYKNKQPFQMIEDTQRRAIIQKIYQDITKEFPTENDLIEAETAITCIKNMMMTDEEAINKIDTETPHILEFYKQYLSQLKAKNQMDYDDQMRYALKILAFYPDVLAYYHEKYRYICVDEAQDTSKLQHRIIKALASKYNNIFMVGDEDQSIYGFRAAYPQALMAFRDDYQNPFVLYIEQNYRSTPEIVDAAQKFIEKNRNRHPKYMVANRTHGEPITRICVNSRFEQYAFLLDVLKQKHGEIAVLSRNNENAVPLIDLLLRNRIPYYAPNNHNIFFSSRIVTDILCFLRLVVNPFDTDAFMQIYYKCHLRFNKKTATFACNRTRRERIPITESLKRNLSKWGSLLSKAEAFSNVLTLAKQLPTMQAIQKIYDCLYKHYTSECSMDIHKIDILRALAFSEPNIQNFLIRIKELQELIPANSQRAANAVEISTIHSGKGKEFDTVYLMDVFNGYCPKSLPDAMDENEKRIGEYQEERRVFYVAMTRAKNRLFLFRVKSFTCSFVDEVPAHSYTPHKNNTEEVAVPEIASKYSSMAPYTQRTQFNIESILLAGSRQKSNAIIIESENPESSSQQLGTSESRYEIGYSDVKEKFNQQTTIIRDRFKQRWVKCERCGEIKPENDFISYGGENHVNLGVCKACKSSL